MIVPAYISDQDTGETVAVFGMDVDPLDTDWHPTRWAYLKRYRVPATGPGHHAWAHWSGAVAILLAVALVLGRAL